MSFFISAMALPGLMSRPPVSKQMPLPTMVTFGARSEPQRRSISRGARSLALPTAWIMGKLSESRLEPSVTLMVALCSAPISRAAVSSSAGPRSFAGMLIRSRPKEQRLGKRLNARAVDAVRQHEPLRLGVVLRLVAAEAIGAGEPGERRQLGVWKRRGEAIVARWERPRQRTRQAAASAMAQSSLPTPSRGPANAAACVRQEQDGARLGRPAPRLEPVPLGVGQLFQMRIVLAGDEPDGKGLGALVEQQISEVTARFRQGSGRHDARFRNGLDGGPH